MCVCVLVSTGRGVTLGAATASPLDRPQVAGGGSKADALKRLLFKPVPSIRTEDPGQLSPWPGASPRYSPDPVACPYPPPPFLR